MEKELLQKIYILRKIKPDSGFVLGTKENIIESGLQNEAKQRSVLQNPLVSFDAIRKTFDYLTVPVNYNSKVALSGVFIFLLSFTFLTLSSFPVSYDYNNYNNLDRITPQKVATEEDDEEVKLVAEDEDNNIDVAQTEKPVSRQFTALETNLRKVQKEVLGMIIKEDPDQELTDKEMADYIVASIEKSKEDDTENAVGVMQMQTVEEKEDPKLEEAMELYKAEDYEEFIHTILDVLDVKELLDILSE